MTSLFSVDTFVGFGPTRLHPIEFVPTIHALQSRSEKKLHVGVKEQAPKLPGVYGMLDRKGNLIYVGKAKQLRNRLMSYFRKMSRDPKAGRILQHTARLVWETCPNEFAALIRELELIRRFRPRFNVLGQPGRQRYNYLCVGRSPAPYVFMSKEPTGKEVACYGPLVGRGRADEAVRRLNDLFRLRDCSQRQTMYFSDQPELFPVERSPGCLRYEISTCSGPCAGRCSRTEYADQIRGVKAFLDGSDVSVLTEIQKQMLEASVALQFERATALRDKWLNLSWLVDRLTWLRTARHEHSFIYPITGTDRKTIWYLIHRGRVQLALYEPKNKRAKQEAKTWLETIFRDLPDIGTVLPKGQVDSVLLVAGWFRRHPKERDGLLTCAQAIERC